MKVAILWQGLSGYLNSSLLELHHQGHEIFICYKRGDKEAPFNETNFSWLSLSYSYTNHPDLLRLSKIIDDFAPDIILISSWHIKEYKDISRKYLAKIPRVLCMDNQWNRTAKQLLGIMFRSILIRPFFDYVFLPGERSAQFARLLGFNQSQIYYGLYSADTNLFKPQEFIGQRPERAFIQVSRANRVKGVRELIQAYINYRRLTPLDPWQLYFCGVGDEIPYIEGVEGVKSFGFLGPNELLDVFYKSDCFILNSSFEPWGVAIHEAAAVGLPIICTNVCGASIHLVQDGYNGYIIDIDNVSELTQKMLLMTEMPNSLRHEMGSRSAILSQQFSPKRWVGAIKNIHKNYARKIYE